ncbi:hypothetical protein H4Q26_005261 [Puccinia striiformis f. sp. tritici PST-130]|nr:hypothetical protein H4Q26_005261 [Puccinia striiformis f. sp. tritici PST-130]
MSIFWTLIAAHAQSNQLPERPQTCGQTDPLATANRTRRGEEDHGNSAWAPKTLAVDLLTSLPQDNSSTFEKVLRDSFTSDGSGWISMRAHASWILHLFFIFLQYLLMLMPEAVILFAKFVSALFAGLVSIATIRPFGAETPLFGFNLTSLARCAELFTENASGSFINSFANSPPENLVGHLHAPIRVASSLMTTACLQETYLLEEPCDQEVEKHHRAHHRGYNAPPTREKSRIRRFLLNSSPSRQLAVDDGSDVHTELPIKSSRSFIGYRASTVGDAAGLDAKPLSKLASQSFSMMSRSASRRRPSDWFTIDTNPGVDRLPFRRGAIDAGQGSRSATAELFLNNIHPSTPITPEPPSFKTEPACLTVSPPGLERPTRKPHMSISKNFMQYCLPSPKSPLMTWSPNPDAAAQISLRTAGSEGHSEIGFVTSPIQSPQGPNSLVSNLRKLTLNSRRNLRGNSKSRLPVDPPPHDFPFLEAPPPPRIAATRTGEFCNEKLPQAALDQGWFAKTHGQRYHPHPRSDVPYWFSYSPQVTDHHILMQYASSILQGSSSPFQLSFSPSRANQHPDSIRRVLDIGCGPAATWCVGVLRETCHVEVVGLDICPLLLDIQSLEGPVAEKLSFVKHNFWNACYLSTPQSFPPIQSFDYVHTSFIASGTPEQKWASLLGEMARVLKRQGTLEILECNTLIADPIKAQAPNPLNDQAKQGGIFRQASMAGAWNASCISVNRESESLRESMLEVAPQSVKGMVDKLLEQHFISPFPLSLLPSEVSNVTTSMKRPLAETFIRFPSDLQSFVDTQTKSPDRAATFPEAGTEEVLPSNDRRVKDAADESMGMLLLHSHVDAMYSTKEISWSDLWPPSLHCETTSSNLPSIAPKRTSSRRPTISSRPFQQIRRNRHFSTNTKVKSDCYERSVYEASFDKPVYDESAPMPHEGKLSSYGKLRSMSQLTLNTTIHEGSSTFDLHLDRRDSVQHQCEPEQLIHDSSRDSSGFRASTQRKNFDQIWDQWKEDLSCNSLGISKLLELRFGWTCALDIENHQALCEYYEVYQQELTHCETQIHELGGRLQEMKYPRVSSQPHLPFPSHLSNHNGAETHRPQSFEYETSSEDDEDFEHVHFPRYSTDNWRGNSDAGYGGNVPQHESDYQSSEESVLNIRIEDIKVRSHAPHPLEKSGHRSPISQPEERLPDKNGDLVTYIREQVGSESEDCITEDGTVSLRAGLSGSQINSKYISPKEEETDSGVEMEIDNLTRQKDQIKKTIQQIQNDLDNVARRLGLSDPETFQPAIQTIPEVNEEDSLVIIAKHDERHKDNVAFPGALGGEAITETLANKIAPGPLVRANPRLTLMLDKSKKRSTFDGLFAVFDKAELTSFLSDDHNQTAFASSQSIENESPKHTHNDSATRISTFNRNTTSSMSDLTSSLCRVAKDLRFTNAGFGDLKIEYVLPN